MRRNLEQSNIGLRLILRRTIGLPSHVLCVASFARGSESQFLGKGKPWQTPFYVKDTGVQGPTVVITGGIHGIEPAGARAAEQIRHWPIVWPSIPFQLRQQC